MSSKKCVNRAINLRSGQDIFLVGSCEKDILGSKLPSMKQVHQLLFYKMRVERLGLKKSMKYTISVTLQFWEKANIPTICEKNCIGTLEKLYNKWKSLQKNSNRSHGKCKENEAEFIEKINNFIFDIAAPDAMEKMKIKEDKDFLTQQRKKGRPGSMSGVDSVLANKDKRREKRLEEAEKRIAKYNSQVENLSNVFESDDNEDADKALPIAADDEIVNAVNNQSKKTLNRGTFNFVDDRMLASMDKCNLSTRHAMHLVSATAAALFQKLQDVTPERMPINLEDLILNRTTLHAMRKEYRRRQAEKIIDEFDIPELFVLHWDGKLLPEMKGREKQERLAIVVTGDKIEKLLGVPKLDNSSGEKIAEATYHFLQEWKLDNLIEIVCFDTTASNTGINNGAAFLLEKKLGRNLLFLPCRHHISELLIKTVFETKFGKTSAPEVLLFNRFSKHWKNIKLGCFQNGISDPDVKNVFTSVEIENLKIFSKQALELDYSRSDYKELLQLSLLFIGENVPNFTQIRQPGATSHARFMSKCIYCYKIFLFRDQFKLTSSELKNLRNICIFLTKIYVPYWFTCINAIDAPAQDLKLIKDAILYFDKEVSNALLHKIKNHLWYLSEEIVGLSFFDEAISLEIKRKMVKAINIGDNEIDFEIDTPKRIVASVEDLQSYSEMDISDFVSPKTYKFFMRLNIDTSFINSDPSTWQTKDDYRKAKSVCQTLTVVNDAAERAVKLITDFNRTLTYDEEDKQFLLQVVEHYRKTFPSHKKSVLLPKEI